MKSTNIQLLTFSLLFLSTFLVVALGLPLWSFVLIIPTLIYSQLYLHQSYSFRETLMIEDVPTTGYEKRLLDLEANQRLFYESGFVKFDEFYMRTANDVVSFAYQHKSLPVFLCEYHFEQLSSYDFITKFDNDFSLTTTKIKNVHIMERPVEKMLQSFPKATFEELFQKHLQGIEFLKTQGFEPREMSLTLFRKDFLEQFLKQGRQLKGLLGPAKILYLLNFGDKNRYKRSVQEQFLARTLLLP